MLGKIELENKHRKKLNLKSQLCVLEKTDKINTKHTRYGCLQIRDMAENTFLN